MLGLLEGEWQQPTSPEVAQLVPLTPFSSVVHCRCSWPSVDPVEGMSSCVYRSLAATVHENVAVPDPPVVPAAPSAPAVPPPEQLAMTRLELAILTERY